MRKTALVLFLLAMTAPTYAQTTSGASSSVNISNPPSTDSKTRLITVPTVVAPGLAAAGVETCLGSATRGMSLMGLGFTFGRTTPDEGCAIRLTARQLFAFGFRRAAIALMCQDTRVAEAMASVGEFCPAVIASAPRRRQKAGELSAPSAGGKQKFSGDITGSINPPRRIVVAWRNPDLVRDPSTEGAASVISPEEQRWFDRVSPAY
jgi:hypothetical protein